MCVLVCRSCIVQYIEENEQCPICETEVPEDKIGLFLRKDTNLQTIVYKLVPDLHQSKRKKHIFWLFNFMLILFKMKWKGDDNSLPQIQMESNVSTNSLPKYLNLNLTCF